MDKRPELRLSIEHALIGIHSQRSGKIFAKWLKYGDFDRGILRQISSRSDVSHDAGPELVKLLDLEDDEIVRDVIELLGEIGYRNSIEQILPFITQNTDIFMNASALSALGNLKASTVNIELKKIARSHWYPPIRDIAKTAINKIDGVYAEPQDISDEFDEIIPILGMWGDMELCEKITKRKIDQPKNIKLYKQYAEAQLKLLAINTEIVGYTAFDEEQQIKEAESKGEQVLIEVNSSNMIEVRESVVRIPHVALKYEDGWLVGTDSGEWGGELAFIDKDKNMQLILKDNIEDIYKLENRYFVVAGLSHMILSRGTIYELFDQDGDWTYKKIHSLPAAPFSLWIVESGEVLINTNAGNILLSPEGSLSMAECIE